MMETEMWSGKKIAYLVGDLRRSGPINQMLNIIRFSGALGHCVVIALFDERDPADTMAPAYEGCGIPVLRLGLDRNTFFLTGREPLRRALAEQTVALVHSYGVKADSLATVVLRGTDIKHIISLRVVPVEDMTTRMRPWLGRALAQVHVHMLRQCKQVVACSQTLKSKVEEQHALRNVVAIKNGVDVESFYSTPAEKTMLRQKYGVDENALVLICTNSFFSRKRNDEICRAFLEADRPDSLLILLGDGPLLKDMRREYGGARIRFPGKVKEVREYLAMSDLFLSASESEGLPNAVLEALACGLPVFLSDIPQHMEVLAETPGAGKTFPLGNVDALRALLRETALEELEGMKKQTAQIRTSSMTMKAMGKQYGAYYAEVLA